MKKKLEFFRKKMPILAVMIILLIIGTASAALILNYATLSGIYEVKQTVYVLGDNEDNDLITFGIDGVGSFIIINTGNDTKVEIFTTLYLDLPVDPTEEDFSECKVIDVEGITININGTDLTYEEDRYLPITIEVLGEEPGIKHVIVIFESNPALVPGVYTIQVEVNPTSTT